MNLLLDTHVLLWAAGVSKRLPDDGRTLLEEPETQPVEGITLLTADDTVGRYPGPIRVL